MEHRNNLILLLASTIILSPCAVRKCQGARGMMPGPHLDPLDSETEVFKIRLRHQKGMCVSVATSHFQGRQKCSSSGDLYFLTSAEHPNYGGLQIQKLGTATCLAATWQELRPSLMKPVARMQPCDPFVAEQYWVFDVITGQLKASDTEYGVFCLSATSADGLELCHPEKKEHRFVLGPEVSRIAAQQELLDIQD